MLPSRNDAVFVLDAESGPDANGNWIDSGPHGLAAAPVNYAAPAWGFTRGPSGAACVSFNGLNQRWTLPLRFYQYAPTSDYTWVLAYTSLGSSGTTVFSAWNGALLGMRVWSPERIRIDCYDGGAANYLNTGITGLFNYRTRVLVAGRYSTVTSPTEYVLDGTSIQNATGGTTITGIVYDTAVVPTMGSAVGGGAYTMMSLYYLACFGRILADSEARDITSMLRDRL